jgi:hypothetical protein
MILILYVSSSSPLQNNPIKTITSSTQWNKKFEWLKKISITQRRLITAFLFNSIKVTEDFTVFLEKLALVFLFHQNIDCFILQTKC